jgi:para-nitrobenzyl esterase
MVIVNTKKGKVKGVQESDYQLFYGIPYAKPPIGNLRFMGPQPIEPWNDIKEALNFKAIPPQNYVDDPPIGQEESEDCLYLNIWTPQADDKERPVMFWIHGGGFVIGAGSRKRLNGSKLATLGNVVVVTFNYRLGALGFLNLPIVTPNLGILDQVAALQWVKENIERFGGDPGNITIFGESAGGMSVGILLTISSAKGLFQKGIIESGATNPTSFEPNSARQGAEKFVKKLGLKNADINDLQSVPLDKLMKVQKKIAGNIFDLTSNPFRPFIDGKIMTEQPIEIIRKGNSSNVPIIIGYNSEELGMIANLLEDSGEVKRKLIMKVIKSQLEKSGILKGDLDKLIEIYKKEIKKKYPDRDFKYWDFLLSDSMFRIPILRQLEAHLEYDQKIYHYIFDYNSPKFGAALHTFEIAFVFGTLGKDMVQDAVVNSKDSMELCNLMMKTWVNFAKTGNPDHEGIPEWKPYDIKNRNTMILSNNPKVISDPDVVLRKAWDDVYNYKKITED